eukprot:6470114-Amphidinium_carterae.1
MVMGDSVMQPPKWAVRLVSNRLHRFELVLRMCHGYALESRRGGSGKASPALADGLEQRDPTTMGLAGMAKQHTAWQCTWDTWTQ